VISALDAAKRLKGSPQHLPVGAGPKA